MARDLPAAAASTSRLSLASIGLRAEVALEMNNEELILVTGATGFLGVQLVRELLEQRPNATMALLIRDRAGQSGQQRADSFIPSVDRSRVQVFSGDVSQPGCGLNAETYRHLQAETTRVVHS